MSDGAKAIPKDVKQEPKKKNVSRAKSSADLMSYQSSPQTPAEVVIELADGTYDEQVYLWKIRNSSAINTITFKSLNNAFNTKLTFFGGTNENHATILMNNAQYITLDELTVENRNLINGSCIQFAGNAKFNTIKNCVIRLDSTQTPYPNSLVGIVSSKLGTLMTTPACYGINSSNNTITGNKILFPPILSRSLRSFTFVKSIFRRESIETVK
jgi:hypothetical protein